MRDKFYETGPIPVTEIKLDVNNVRYFNQVGTQDEVIRAMLNDPRANLESLAKDFLDVGGLTPDPIVLYKDEENGWVVIEGNRRIAALKLLNNPLIAPKEYRKKFESIITKFKELPSEVNCIACDDLDIIFDYLERRHSGERNGTGQVDWNAANRAASEVRRGKPTANALANKAIEIAREIGAQLKTPYPRITTLQRVMQDPLVQSMLGLMWDSQAQILKRVIDDDVAKRIISELVKCIEGKKVREVFNQDQRKSFIKDFLDDIGQEIKIIESTPVPVGESSPPSRQKLSAGGGGATGGGGGPRKPTYDRGRLIPPRGLGLPIQKSDARAYNIFHELSHRIDVRLAPNAAAVLFRVLLELGIERYIKTYSVNVKNKDDFKFKVRKVAEDMLTRGEITSDRKTELERFWNNEELFSAKTLHLYVHSPNFHPAPQTLCIFWDSIHDFIHMCWR